jgi:dUTP pyrophosphatase
MIFLHVQRVGAIETPVPSYAHEGDAGLDLSAAIDSPLTVLPGRRGRFPTGWAIEIPSGLVGLVLPRSGLQDRDGIAAGTGVIDAPYRGQIHVTLFNHGAFAYTVQPLDRIAQLVLLPVGHAAVRVVPHLSESARGADGFGSTGR